MKLNALFLVCGIFIGVVLSACGYAVYQIGQGFAGWGALTVTSDAVARNSITGSGVALPEEAHHLYFARDGFQDHNYWIKFTVPKDRVWEVVERSKKRKRADFVSGISQNFLKEIHQAKATKEDLGWWNPATVKRPLGCTFRQNGSMQDSEDWVVDEDAGTIYITKWDV